ncbi:unnamed protein product [Cylicocyclus nassatus]|uniref:C-type lectin domain-containing protein n=1 Tax=Cylicocyclus nassatus TaxID=53992 RepID=A0AA36M708_CYLNA|nr:unnamed protein product [Cylicocyclus nassatus]
MAVAQCIILYAMVFLAWGKDDDCTCESAILWIRNLFTNYKLFCHASFDFAEKKCRDYYNGHLASIHSEKENNIIRKFAQKESDYVWIGLRRKGNRWRGDCVRMLVDKDNKNRGRWETYDCKKWTRFYVCKFKKGPETEF